LEATAERFDAVAHSLQADPVRLVVERVRNTDTIIRNRKLNAVARTFQRHFGGRSECVPVNVHQGFLNDPEHGGCEGFCDPEKVACRFECDPDRCTPAEIAAQGLQGQDHTTIAKLSGIFHERERPDLAVNLPDRIIDFDHKVVMAATRLDPAKATDAQLERDQQLAGRIMQFLSDPLSLKFADLEELTEKARSR